MKPFPLFLSSLLVPLVLVLSSCQPPGSATARPPVEVGKTYWITFPNGVADKVSTSGRGFLAQYTSVKVLKLAGGPWVEVETSWTPQMQFEEGKSVPPTTKTEVLLLNLDHVLLIKELPDKP
ncbi:hypothetical protein OVA24_08490 [Luteolibacter sp. SL250]|uniref:hypothetical protein n=1 Tax=Luteolibacter sp. SL250 TaxID=2995170 RepID=UPI00227165BB|nr:hypothetical protein [Luteolibacter sp. SL250]WAC21423.1 hypothetical protein OVA24_08490 [Luteolibacter sp. SL250]